MLAVNLSKYERRKAHRKVGVDAICFTPTQMHTLRKLGRVHDDEITLHRETINGVLKTYYTLTFHA